MNLVDDRCHESSDSVITALAATLDGPFFPFLFVRKQRAGSSAMNTGKGPTLLQKVRSI